MISEKDLKLTINKMYNDIRSIDLLKHQNAINYVYSRTIQIVALMKILQREEIFTKQEIDSYNKPFFQLDKINVPIVEEKEKQLTLDDVSDEDLQLFVREFNNRKSNKKTKSKPKELSSFSNKKNNIQELQPTERI